MCMHSYHLPTDIHIPTRHTFHTTPVPQPHQHQSVRGLATCIIDNYPVVLTGGTDRTIRLWNLIDPGQCCCVVRPKHHTKRIHIDYK